MRLLLISLVLGCHATDVLQRPTIPAATGAQILLFVQDGALTRAHAIDPEEPLYPSFSRRNTVQLYSFSFDCGLETLGLSPGPIPLRTFQTSEILPPSLPPPKLLETAELSENGLSAWTQLGPSNLTDRLLAQLVTPADLCALGGPRFDPFDPTIMVEGMTPTPTIGVPLSERTALVATASGAFFSVDVQGPSTELNLPASTPHNAAFARDDGTLFLLGMDGRMVTGTLEALEPGPQLNAQGPFALDGRSDGPVELFAASMSGQLFRFDGQWQVVHSVSPELGRMPSVAWLAPGRAIVAAWLLDQVLEIRDGQVNLHNIDSMLGEPNVVTRAGDGTGIMGTAKGWLLRLVEDGFAMVPGAEINGPISVAAPWRDGFIYGGLIGLVGRNVMFEFNPKIGLCPIEHYPFLRTLVPLAEDALLVIEEPLEERLLLKGYIETNDGPKCLR